MLYELRQYRIKPGARDAWVRLMDEKIIPFQKSCGITVTGSFIACEDDDLYIWIRCFENEAARKDLYDKVYGSAEWQGEIRKAMGDMLLKQEIKVTLMKATEASDLR